jgi:hypothetical protein
MVSRSHPGLRLRQSPGQALGGLPGHGLEALAHQRVEQAERPAQAYVGLVADRSARASGVMVLWSTDLSSALAAVSTTARGGS